jgi:hypothetical protein
MFSFGKKEVSNREIQVDLLCFSLLFLTSIIVVVFFHRGDKVTFWYVMSMFLYIGFYGLDFGMV